MHDRTGMLCFLFSFSMILRILKYFGRQPKHVSVLYVLVLIVLIIGVYYVPLTNQQGTF